MRECKLNIFERAFINEILLNDWLSKHIIYLIDEQWQSHHGEQHYQQGAADVAIRTSDLMKNRQEINEVQNRITENILITKKSKSNTDSNLILTCLKNHFIFYNLSEGEMYVIRYSAKMLRIACILHRWDKEKSSIPSKIMEPASLLSKRGIWNWSVRTSRKRRFWSLMTVRIYLYRLWRACTTLQHT